MKRRRVASMFHNRLLNINFSSIPKYVLYTKVYEAIWNDYGEFIVGAFGDISHINFTEKTINVAVGNGDKDGNNFAGNQVNDPMLLRYNVRDKLGTIFHELGHRLILEHNYFIKSKDALQISNEHQLLDLFLYDVIGLVFGESTANSRVRYEMSFSKKKYRESWEWALGIKKTERQSILKKLALKFA